MLKKTWIIAAAASFALAGCLETDLQRGVAGAAGGLVTAEVLGTDPTATAVAGVAAGLLCDDAGICRSAR
ncbi:hypothetical protein FHS72_000470 [Loktanella ponticola]|uniref:YMGG-like Gly-zipper domain-containing protein n=1 Tax=Yoonia ponticola TaxID=1524255 RepID=A0A7W9EYG2_9RHOB|nr:hypothetical protein [Yoonia ponticola]MBB5720866.1 hypothetical protein [Yoonia ponticola]